MGGYVDKTKVDTAFAGSAALLAAAEGADAQTLLTSLERANRQAAEEFHGFLKHLREDPDKGKMAALQALHPVKGDVEAASQMIELLLESAGGLQVLAPAQVAEAREICETLNLSPSRFNL
jgi:tellurite resistance protein